MSVKFKDSGHLAEYETILDDIERLENLAYQAERSFWNAAYSQWRAKQYIDHNPRIIASSLCAGAEDFCNQILERLAYVCGASYSPLSWGSNINSLYVGSTGLDIKTLIGREITKKKPQLSIVAATSVVPVTVVDVGYAGVNATTTSEEAKQETEALYPTALGAIDGLRSQILWMKQWFQNASTSDVWDAYEAALATVYTNCVAFVANLGPNFATPLTAFYSLNATGVSNYSHPKISASFNTSKLVLSCINDIDTGTLTAPQGSTTGFHLIGAGDLIHVVRLGIDPYSAYEDKLYYVDAVSSTQLTLITDTDEPFPEIISRQATEFGDLFLLRKVRGA